MLCILLENFAETLLLQPKANTTCQDKRRLKNIVNISGCSSELYGYKKNLFFLVAVLSMQRVGKLIACAFHFFSYSRWGTSHEIRFSKSPNCMGRHFHRWFNKGCVRKHINRCYGLNVISEKKRHRHEEAHKGMVFLVAS